MTTRILCVCHGNTCRSPMAEGVLRALAAAAGVDIEVDSAGVEARSPGSPPDPRGLAAAARRGYDNSALRVRQVAPEDFSAFDLILAMDASNIARLRALCPEGSCAHIGLFDPTGREIPDPFHGAAAEYERALDLIEDAARARIASLAAR